MPGRDGTGPQGKGPMTGRGMGMQQGAKRRKKVGAVSQQEPQKSNDEKLFKPQSRIALPTEK